MKFLVGEKHLKEKLEGDGFACIIGDWEHDDKELKSEFKIIKAVVIRLNQDSKKSTCPRCQKKFRNVRWFGLWKRKEDDDGIAFKTAERPDQIFPSCKKCYNEMKIKFYSGEFKLQ